MTPRRVDSNQRSIVAALREFGASVVDLHEVGHGCPDISVGYGGRTFLFEIKSEKGRLTEDELIFQRSWKGEPIYVIHSIVEAIEIIQDRLED